jgi:hypothetical protein
VFAAGVVFLELISSLPPNCLYHDLWPMILDLDMPRVLSLSLSGTLQKDPTKRNTFDELFQLLSSEEGKKIADHVDEENAAEFYDFSGKVLDYISSNSSQNFSESSPFSNR